MAARNWLGLGVGIAIALMHGRTVVAAEVAPQSLAATVAPVIQDFMAARTSGTSVVIPGLSVAIGQNGSLLYADGFGDAAPDRRATSETIYMVGSITKQFTAAAVLRLIDQRARPKDGGAEISTATALADVLDVAKNWTLENGPPITVGHLLSMTSNLPNYTRRPPEQLDPWGAVPALRLLGRLKDFRPSGFPGSFEYSNTSYFLLAELLEAVTVDGRTRDYHQIVRDEVFSRLGLDNTGFESDPALAARLAAPHYHRMLTFTKPDWLKGCGDVASNVLDLFKWDKALMEGAALSPNARAVMFSESARVDVWTYYGAGWFVMHKDGVDRYFHSGTVSGYTSFNLIVQPSAGRWTSVSLLTNSDGVAAIDELADKLAALAMD